MNYIPVNTATTNPQSGGMGLPEGWYLLQLVDATEVRTEQNGEHQRRAYKTKVIMGPGATQEMAGKPYTDWIRDNDQQWASRHMELFVACLGSLEAVRATGAQHGGHLPAEVLHGKYYIAQLVKSGNFTNTVQRIPYTQENWTANVGNGQPQQPQGMLTQQMAPAPTMQMAAPAPMMPQMQYAAPQVPQMQPVGLPTVAVPPPPPGMPAVGR